jgi:hypothetical protein
MKLIKLLIMFVCVFFVVGCASSSVGGLSPRETVKKLPVSYVLSGTSTAVVGIGVDKNGIPLETVKEVVLTPGQKVIFAGPDKFEIKFKKKKAPSEQIEYQSQNGVIAITIPRDIFDQPNFSKEYKEQKYLRFDYSIFVNGRELDPPLIVKRDN